jgi:AAA+ ATPase superfamily predicted ATPase
MFVNRSKEIARIQSSLSQKSAQLIAIYGRRRCGKTTLLQNVLPPDAIYFAADLREMSLQISSLAREIGSFVPGFERAIYPDWEILFQSFNQAIQKSVTLIIDEFPYLVRNCSELPSVLQKFYDHKANIRFHLIICGSSQQMMSDLVLNVTSPLYGRCDEIIRINPMGLGDLVQFLKVPAINTLEEYSIWGGIPRYWELRRQSSCLTDAIIWNILDENGILHDEPERLFSDEMRTSVQAFTIISLIAGGSNRLSEIAARIGKPATHLSRIMGFLIDLGYIRREIPFGESLKSTKKSLYKLNDPFLKFYFTFVIPNKSRLRFGQINEVWKEIESKIVFHFSEIWEEQCRLYFAMNEICGHRFLPGSRWWGGGTDRKPLEIDYVAESDDHKYLLIAEIKWSKKIVITDILREMNRKISLLPVIKGKSLIIAICIKDKTGISEDGVILVDAADVAGTRTTNDTIARENEPSKQNTN